MPSCNSCGKDLTNERGITVFPCPGCLGYEIVRCKACKRAAIKWSCYACGQQGPN